MLLHIARFELWYRLRKTETYLYFLALFGFAVFGVDFVFSGELGQMAPNAPYVIAFAMAAITAIFMLVVSLLVGTAVLRDVNHQTGPIFWTSPISNYAYLGGRFLGVFAIVVVVFLGLPLGMICGELLPWRIQQEPLRFDWISYALPFLFQVLPSLFMASALFFVSATLSRKMIVVYTQGILLFVAYLLGVVLTQEADSLWLATLLDPFSFRTSKLVTQYWSVSEVNHRFLMPEGILLWNRIFYLLIGVTVFLYGIYCFSPEPKKWSNPLINCLIPPSLKEQLGNRLAITSNTLGESYGGISSEQLAIPQSGCGAYALIRQSIFYFRSIISERAFMAITICGALIILINSVSLGVAYGVDSLPLTYLIVEDLQETSVFFFLILLLFYSGQLVWREREIQLAQVIDVNPVSNLTLLTAKYLGLLLVFVLLILILIGVGILFQLANGYWAIAPEVYLLGFGGELFFFLSLYTAVALFLQSLINQKYVAHLVFLLFFIGTQALGPLGFRHGLINFSGPGIGIYSEMNGYANSLEPFLWFSGYWQFFAFILMLLTSLLVVRGSPANIRARIREGRTRTFRYALLISLLLFALGGAYIFYNTDIINNYWSDNTSEQFRVRYEQQLKQFEYLAQPVITAVDLTVDLYPDKKAYDITGAYTLYNHWDDAITEIHLQRRLEGNLRITSLRMEDGAIIDTTFGEFGYLILRLREPLLPGSSRELFFSQKYTTKGFVEQPATRIVANGTFLTNDHLPTLGYNRKYELVEANRRIAYNLPERDKLAAQDNIHELKHDRTGADADLIEFGVTISTAADQTAIAPGSLVRQWRQAGRNYFTYQSQRPIINFYAILSGRYQEEKATWPGTDESPEQPVALSIFHHPGHTQNLERMQLAMRETLNYCSTAFGAYQYDHLRIIEFPRYAAFAQSFPGTIPFSEAIGFVMDIDDATEVDMAFFITAHEVAHQWWGMQLQAANVAGKQLILESLAQYTALMVLRKVYGEDKTLQLLRREEEIYLRERTEATAPERPLVSVDGREYLHYSKGALCFYTLSEMVGEATLNSALVRFLDDWGVKHAEAGRTYATAADLLTILQEELPLEFAPFIQDLFREITVFDLAIVEARIVADTGEEYQVEVNYQLKKTANEIVVGEGCVPVPLAFYATDGQLLLKETVWLPIGKGRFLRTVPVQPERITIDPDGLLLEVNRSDNTVLLTTR